ncbi:glycosyltransferase family 4 protein [Aureimonas sp. SK2]|uniref:glycosyltransferase family 4 protein n=1 Tax=Aureimonas sp. SK2 TaxID=3015992 RepID=UPI0024449FAC|nr:glycosyltransferase family 4 protein [Aureimonas sp. SK2]
MTYVLHAPARLPARAQTDRRLGDELKILHFAQNVAGGISSYFDEIAQHQVDRYGAGNVRFLMPRRDIRNLTCVPLECVEPFDPVGRDPLSLLRLARLAVRYSDEYRPDVVHLHSTFAGAVYRLALPFLKHRPKVIYCPHGWAFAREQPWLASFIYARLEALMMRMTDVCINISQSEARLAAQYGVSLNRAITVPNGISRRGAAATPSPARQNGTIELLFVGRHDPQKGIDILLHAMSLVANPAVRLTVVGAPVVSNKRIDLSAVPPSVTMLGPVTRDMVSELMRACDAIVVPSRWEGFGLVVLEAMRVGRPVIVSPNGALPDLVEEGRTGIVAPELTPECLAGIIDSLSQPGLARMGEAAARRFLYLYTSDRMNADIDAIYEGLVPSRVPAGTRWGQAGAMA